MKNSLGHVLIHGTLCTVVFVLTAYGESTERHPEDGWFNNLIHPDWGAIDGHLLRKSPAKYSDGVYEPAGQDRPNPLDVSKIAFKGNDKLGSFTNRNAMLVFFGQQLVEEIMDAQRPGCPREYFNIPVPTDHKYYNPHGKEGLEMPFLRSRYDQRTGHSPNNPRQQLNEITPFLDGNLIYGAGKAVSDALREFKGGRLAADRDPDNIVESFPKYNNIRLPFANPPSPRDHVLKPVSRFHMFGNPRAHENPFLASLGVVWFRYHNLVAKKLGDAHPDWDDERLFDAARKRVIAQYQKITMYEWLPAWLPSRTTIAQYKGYNPNVHPGISSEFAVAAMRFGHTLVPSGVFISGKENSVCKSGSRVIPSRFTNRLNDSEETQTVKTIRLCNSFWVPEETLEGEPGLDDVITSMIYTKAAREDNIIVSDIRENVFGPLEWSRRDLGALNIQRGRDHGLPGYNDVRQAYGLGRKTNWRSINYKYVSILDKLQSLYNSSTPDDLDVFPGGLLETTSDGPGELFTAITLDQFLRIRDGDRFWYENPNNGLFTTDEINEIQRTTFYNVLSEVTNFLNVPGRKNAFKCEKKSPIDCECSDPNMEATDPHETCVPLQTYDYFNGSEISFVATLIALVLSVGATVAVMMLMARTRRNSLSPAPKESRKPEKSGPYDFYALEWVGRSSYGHLNSRNVKIYLDDQRAKLLVSNMANQVIRMIDLRRRISDTRDKPRASVTRSMDKGHRLLMVAVPGEIDLVLHFSTKEECDEAFERMNSFFKRQGWDFHEGPSLAEHVMWREANTYDQRKRVLNRFFRKIMAEISSDQDSNGSFRSVGDDEEEDVLQTKLTRTEFADAMGLQPQSLFVRNMYLLVDSTGDGFISFDEFKNYFGILCSGSPEQKAEMFFKMFDTKRTGKLTRDNYKKMILSLMELNDATDSKAVNIEKMVDAVFQKLNRQRDGYLTFNDFKTIMFSEDTEIWKSAVINLEIDGNTVKPTGQITSKRSTQKRAQSFIAGYRSKVKHITSSSPASEVRIQSEVMKAPQSKLQGVLQMWCRYVDNHKSQIFWLSLYTLITLAIFAERAYYYSFEREHGGLRRLAGYGVSVTRGAASAQMFTYASLLVTMSRNTLTFFRETVFQRYIPFDSMHDMHIIVAGYAMFFTVMHVIGHVINFYHVSTQASLDLNCYFREYFRATHVLASFHYWTFETITGLTGVLLVIVLAIIYVFATPYARRHVFKHFRNLHNLYIPMYILMFLHGAGRLVQPPLWGYFFIGPMVLFLLDKMVSFSRNKVLIPVRKAVMLPSDVINLVFKKPLTFNYQSGQWVRIACPKLGEGEYHPFTLTSAPHEDYLSLHIRAVGPWTTNLRRLFDPNRFVMLGAYPKIYLDGPFGESHQDWYRFPISVLIGGGIGITPFASILKDIAHRANEVARLPCQKVYFLWVTRNQQGYEWMTDILRQVERADTKDFVNVQICITQLKEKFDLRTTMLYICERHFQKVAGVSMFTGLKAKTHFGRPKFHDFFHALKNVHDTVDKIGVFSCGPPTMTRNIQLACSNENSYTGPAIVHHFENF